MNITPTVPQTPTLPARAPPPLHYALTMSLNAGLEALADGRLHRGVVGSGVVTALSRRRVELEQALAVAPADFVMRSLASLGGMPSQTVASREEAAALMRQDMQDLFGVTAWALTDVCAAFRKGALGDGWRPSVAKLLAEIRKREAPHRHELAQIAKLLDAPALTAEPPKMATHEQVKSLQDGLAKLAAGETR